MSITLPLENGEIVLLHQLLEGERGRLEVEIAASVVPQDELHARLHQVEELLDRLLVRAR
jgi:hypothetical protein